MDKKSINIEKYLQKTSQNCEVHSVRYLHSEVTSSAMDSEELQYDGEADVSEETFNDTDQNIESELEAIKARVREMEDEAEKIRQIQSEVDKQMSNYSPTSPSAPVPLSIEEKMEVDARSIYVGSVDYGATAEELEQHFHGCGAVNRVTILCNKFDGHPKGFAYIEFSDKDSIQMAMALDESLFRGRQLKRKAPLLRSVLEAEIVAPDVVEVAWLLN
ncbi:RNA recognition motif domain [Trinorchestia longiramus]|nr:RNA recognition motif domain [Trinorchestia longiramus]